MYGNTSQSLAVFFCGFRKTRKTKNEIRRNVTSKLKKKKKKKCGSWNQQVKDNGESEREMHRVIAREKNQNREAKTAREKETKRHPVAWPPPLTSHPHSKIKKKDRDKKVKKEREAALPHNKREEDEEKNNFPSKSCSQHSLSSQSSNLFFFSLQAMTHHHRV